MHIPLRLHFSKCIKVFKIAPCIREGLFLAVSLGIKKESWISFLFGLGFERLIMIMFVLNVYCNFNSSKYNFEEKNIYIKCIVELYRIGFMNSTNELQ